MADLVGKFHQMEANKMAEQQANEPKIDPREKMRMLREAAQRKRDEAAYGQTPQKEEVNFETKMSFTLRPREFDRLKDKGNRDGFLTRLGIMSGIRMEPDTTKRDAFRVESTNNQPIPVNLIQALRELA